MYAELNESKTNIMKRYGRGLNHKRASFSVNSSHEDYTALGLYKIIEDLPDLPIGKKYGDISLVVDEGLKTVTINRPIVNKLAADKKANLHLKKPERLKLIDFYETNGIITAARAIELKS